MGEKKKLQGELLKLRTRKEKYLKTLQSWQEEVSEIVLKIDAKITEFKATQTTVASLLEALITVELVDIVQECVDQKEGDLAELKTGLDQFTSKVKHILKEMKTSASGFGMSHK